MTVAIKGVTRDVDQYRSPLKKLVRFFEESRDNWKAKYQKLRCRFKQAENQVRAVEKSRDHWKEVARHERRRVKQLERELQKKT